MHLTRFIAQDIIASKLLGWLRAIVPYTTSTYSHAQTTPYTPFPDVEIWEQEGLDNTQNMAKIA